MTITTRQTTAGGVVNKGATLTNAELDANFVDVAAHFGSSGTAHAVVVASGANGFMLGTDKAKLDAISGSNTGDNAVNSNYSADYRLSTFVAGTNYLAPSGSAASLTNFPVLNQNTTGNAATATDLSGSISTWLTIRGVSGNSIANMLGWRNYGNGHVIFDASIGLAPNGTAVSSTNSQNPWVANYPTLMGWNGTNTFGMRVDSARLADSATVANDVYTWAKASVRPVYTASDVGAYASTNPNAYIALASAITGYTVGTNTALVATDTLNASLGKLQGQVSARASGTGTATGINTGDQTLPTTLPASDVFAWAKASVRPIYTAADVGAYASTNPSGFISSGGSTFAPSGLTEVGRYFDFHGTNSATDFDVRLDSGPGTGAIGGGTLTITAANVESTGRMTCNNYFSVNSAATPLFINSTTSTNIKIAFFDAGVIRGYAGAQAGTCFHVINAANNFYAMTVSDGAGDLTMNGNVTAYSDERLKENWRNLDTNYLEQLAKVKMGVYDRIDSKQTQIGVSAQSLREIMPEAVLEDAQGMLSVAYGNAALATCVALAKKCGDLEARLVALEALLNKG